MSYNGVMELNNVRKDSAFSTGKITGRSPIVEIFSSMVRGKDLSELNSKIKDYTGRSVNVDEGVNYIKELARQAGGGNQYAITELNELRTFTIWPLLEQELKLLGWMGQYQNIGYNETPKVDVYRLAGEKGRVQALRGDVTFGTSVVESYTVPTVVVSAGHQVDYRKVQMGEMGMENVLIEQVRVDMRNKASQYVLYKIWNSISNATGVKFISQGAGITKTALDDIVRSIRRYGQVGIFGDYSVVSQIAGFIGWAGVTPVYGGAVGSPAAVSGVPDAAMMELLKTGLVSNYMGANVVEIQNSFNYAKPKADGSSYELYFPAGLLFIIPSGRTSPIHTFTRGGLTSLTGQDPATGTILTRFDLEVAADVAKGHESEIGLILDTNLTPTIDFPQ
jgi:hypothetical protein